MNKTVLILAFHFPPIAMSSGLQRALKIVRYLRDFGWQPVVLTADPRAYAKTTPEQLSEIPADVPVHRAFGLDSMRHLAIRGKHLGWTAVPDAWVSWFPAAVLGGRKLIREYRPGAIWSTFPIATTNLVALHLSRSANLPWIADLRDPMTLEGFPINARRFKCTRWIEKRTVDQARRLVFTAQHTRRIYEDRYPRLKGRTAVIPNGYDEANFPDPMPERKHRPGECLRIVHSGALQPVGRNPTAFFGALRRLSAMPEAADLRFEIVFRACGFADRYAKLAASYGVSDIVTFADYLPYEDALREMVSADGLLVFQGTSYNHAVPAKLYECMYAGTPIFALVDKSGETYSVLEGAGITSVASIDDEEEIALKLRDFLRAVKSQSYRLPDPELVRQFSRRSQVMRLSEILSEEISRSSGSVLP